MKINISELNFILQTTPHVQNIMLMGKHGIGKSEIITKYYNSIGMRVVPLFLGQMSDPGDIIGLPTKNEVTGKTDFMPPYWFPTDGSPIALFLDELNRARPEILQVVMDLVLNRTLAGKKLPEGSVIVSAINDGDEYTLTELDPALLSRFNVYEFAPTVEEWLRWGIGSGVNEDVIGFISTHDDFLDFRFDESANSNDKSFDRRSWKRVSDILNTLESDPVKKTSHEFCRLLTGVVGQKAGSVFHDYLCNGIAVTADDVLYDFNNALPKMENYGVIAYISLTDRIVSKIDMMRREEFSSIVRENLKRYLDHLSAKGRENIGYFVSVYSSGQYPDFASYISEYDDLETIVMRFVSSLEG